MLISEWLPNPVGKDADGEWIELYNDSGEQINLFGWYLTTGGTAKYKLTGVISTGEYKIIPRSETKFTLRNNDGELHLYNTKGILIDNASFVGTASEGKSAQRIGGRFIFTESTPGTAHEGNPYANILFSSYPPGTLLVGSAHVSSLWFAAFGVALGISFAILYIAKHHVFLSELFFSKN